MSDQSRKPDVLTRAWQSLAERRRQHLLGIYRSGRWRHYYTEESMMAQMRDTVRGVEQWGQLAGAEKAADAPEEAIEPAPRPNDS